MSLSVKQRPQGLKVISGQYSGVITDNSGDALVTLSAHGLVDGDFVFVDSEVTEYNGFWEVDVQSSSTFKLIKEAGFVEFFVESDAPYNKTSLHEWNAAFLPIVYKIYNDRWPVNSYDPMLAITVTEDNGYTRIQFMGTLHDAGVRRFEYVKIEGSTFDGTYQIVEVITPNDLVLALSYDASFMGGTVQYYYNNYQVLINVYGGLPAGHPWAARKPMEVLAVLAIKPDENNISMFSISDVIKTKLAIKNDLGLYSLPLNLDDFTGFQIEYSESFEQSDSYSVFQDELAGTLDSFVGYAAAAQLPFKNEYGGAMSEYVNTLTPAKWLTFMTDLLAVEGYYFDLSVILNDITGDITVLISKYVSDYLTAQETVVIPYQGVGVYRIPITPDAQYDRFCVQLGAYVGGTPGEAGWTPAAIPAIHLWANVNTGAKSWTNPSDDTLYLDYNTGSPGSEISDQAKTAYAFEVGRTYTFRFRFTNTSLVPGQVYNIGIFNIGGTLIDSQSVAVTTSPQDVSITRTATAADYAIGCYYSTGVGVVGAYIVTLAAVFNDTPSEPDIPPDPGNFEEVTEEICFDIVAPCDIAGFVPDDIRLTEDGDFRILE